MTCWAMTNRCDSVDALMYAYYEFMRIKEENQMLEKNKDYIEFTLQCTSVEGTRDKDYREVHFNGYSDSDFPCVPMDVVCKEFSHKVVMISKSDFDRLQADVNINAELAKEWETNYNLLLEKTGFNTVEELVTYLYSEAECDTLHEAISKLKDQVKYTCEEWYSANSRNNSWKAAAECNSPKELIEKIKGFREEIEMYYRLFKEWKAATGCPSPSAAKTLIESQASWCHAYHEVNKVNEKLGDDVKSWKNVTGYFTPEDYMHARISGAFHTPFDYTAAWQKATGFDTPEKAKSHIEGLENAVRLTNRNLIKELESNIDEWQKATGCDTPDKAKERIKALNERIDESEADYNHLLCTTGFESEGEIEDALDKCDHSTLRKALVDYEFDYETLLKLTGYKSEDAIRVVLNLNEQFIYETMRELIYSLKRKAKFTESNWQAATGCNAPEKAQCKITDLYNRIGKMKEAASIASNWTDRIVEV